MSNRPIVFRALVGLILVSLLFAGCSQQIETPSPESIPPTAADTLTPEPVISAGLARDLVVLSIEENGYAHSRRTRTSD